MPHSPFRSNSPQFVKRQSEMRSFPSSEDCKNRKLNTANSKLPRWTRYVVKTTNKNLEILTNQLSSENSQHSTGKQPLQNDLELHPEKNEKSV